MGTGDLYRQWYARLWNIHKRNEKREWKPNKLILEKGEEEIIFKIWLGKKNKDHYKGDRIKTNPEHGTTLSQLITRKKVMKQLKSSDNFVEHSYW